MSAAMTEPDQDQLAPVPPKPKTFDTVGEVGLVSVLGLIASLPVVTWVAAIAAGVAHVRRHLWSYGDTVRDYRAILAQAVPGSWPWALGGVALGILLWFDVALLRAGVVPGGETLAWLSLAVGAVLWAIVTRAAALWSTDEGETAPASTKAWAGLLGRSARVCAGDPIGTLLLVVTLGVSLMLVWMFTPMFILVPGLWVLGAVGVEFRRQSRQAARPH